MTLRSLLRQRVGEMMAAQPKNRSEAGQFKPARNLMRAHGKKAATDLKGWDAGA
jgi:hypothetical protein